MNTFDLLSNISEFITTDIELSLDPVNSQTYAFSLKAAISDFVIFPEPVGSANI